MKQKLPLTGMILAGGKSSRMGQDKALLRFGEKTILEHLAFLLESIFEETLIVVDQKNKLDGLTLGRAKVYEDLLRNKGPLGGIYTGLCYSKCKASCTLTCDMPFVDVVILRQLVDFWDEEQDALCLENPTGSLEPFPGIYARSARHLIHLLLERDERSMHRFLEVAVVKPLMVKEERIEVLTNMNTIQDYYRVLRQKNEETFSS